MKVSTMRSIDRWVGIPICFIVSPFRWLSDVVRSAKRKKPNLSRTLFIELSEMGSAIIVDPAMRKLREEGKGELYFAIFKKNYKSLEILQTIPEENVFKMNAESFWTLVPVPIVWVLPMSTRTEPCRTFSNRACFFGSDSASPMAAICSRGMPWATSFSTISS